jgi:hypothetical protein
MRFNASHEHSASPHCVYHFYAIAIVQQALALQAFRHDFAIDLDRDLASGEARGFEQIDQRDSSVQFAWFAIEQDIEHAPIVTPRR